MQRLVSIKEAAVYTGLSRSIRFYTMVSQRRIPLREGRSVWLKFDQGLSGPVAKTEIP